jgi:hypothetical protein
MPVQLTIKSENKLAADQQKMAYGESDPMAISNVSQLAIHVRKAFDAARTHRETMNITSRLLNCRRLRKGEYTADELAKIIATGGSRMFYNIVGPKCSSFVAWLEDVFSPQADTPWDIKPTPIPSLSKEEAEEVISEVVEEFSEDKGSLEGQANEIVERTNQLFEQTLVKKREAATKKSENMRALIDDQLTEGNFVTALSDFVDDLATYPTAIMKGPVFVTKERLKWKDGELIKTSETIPTWTTVDPFCFYPGPNVRSVDKGDICEQVILSKADLYKMKGVTGWNAEAIDRVLSPSGLKTTCDSWTYGSDQHARLSDRDIRHNSGLADSDVEGIEYWGCVRGSDLRSYQAKIPDLVDEKYYEVCIVMIGAEIVKAITNPDPLDRRPYYVCSFDKNRNSIWGLDAIPEKLEAVQQGVNGSQRSLMNNLAISSGPQVTADTSAMPANQLANVHKMYPWKVWAYDGRKLPNSSRQPFVFFQPDSNSAELIKVTEYYETKADDRTLIPKYVAGDADVGGAGRTASGLSMLMSAAARGIKRVVREVDKEVLRALLERIYSHNMLNSDDASVKGDSQIVPKGALAALVREQTQLRRQEFLQTTTNDIDLKIIGIRGRAALLRSIAEGLDMNVDKIVPSEEKIEAMEKQEEQAAMMEQQSQLMAEDEALRKLGTVPQSNSTQLAPGPTAVNVPAAPSPQG